MTFIFQSCNYFFTETSRSVDRCQIADQETRQQRTDRQSRRKQDWKRSGLELGESKLARNPPVLQIWQRQFGRRSALIFCLVIQQGVWAERTSNIFRWKTVGAGIRKGLCRERSPEDSSQHCLDEKALHRDCQLARGQERSCEKTNLNGGWSRRVIVTVTYDPQNKRKLVKNSKKKRVPREKFLQRYEPFYQEFWKNQVPSPISILLSTK